MIALYFPLTKIAGVESGQVLIFRFMVQTKFIDLTTAILVKTIFINRIIYVMPKFFTTVTLNSINGISK